jgi:hypothetical protein
MPSLSLSTLRFFVSNAISYRGASSVLELIKAGWNRAAKTKNNGKKEARP